MSKDYTHQKREYRSGNCHWEEPEDIYQRNCRVYGNKVADKIQFWFKARKQERSESGNFAKYDCMDSYRTARIGDTEDEAHYVTRITCCGRHDEVLNLGLLGKYKVGFNYGH